MSLLDLILAQTGILLTAGIALLLLLTAIILSVIGRVRKVAAAHAKQNILRAAMARREAEANPPQVEPLVSDTTDAESPVIAGTNQVASVAPAVLLNLALTTPENQPEEPGSDATPSAMQDILSSVFGDDETAAKYDLLLKGLEPIRIEHLRALSLQIAEQLHGQPGGQIKS